MPKIDENGFLAGRISKWIANNRSLHATVFTVASELNRECHRFLSGRGVDPNSTLQLTTAVLFARLMELFQGVIVSVERGMQSAGRILFRAHMEGYLNLMAIYKDPTFLDEYLNQPQRHRRKLVNRIRNSNKPILAPLLETLDENLVKEINAIIEERQIRPLSIEDVARRAGRFVAYAMAYPILSGAVHTTASDLESHLDYDDERQAIRKLNYGPSDSNTEKHLALAGMTMAEALETISVIFGEDRAQLCADFKREFESILKDPVPEQ